jgi:hypothetical protein
MGYPYNDKKVVGVFVRFFVAPLRGLVVFAAIMKYRRRQETEERYQNAIGK